MLSEKVGTPRREWLKRSLIAGTTLLVGLERLSASACNLGVRGQDALRGGKHLGDIDFIHEPRVPFGSLLGSGLDGRLYADLAALSPEHSVVPSSEFYVRTRPSELLDTGAPWQIRLTSSSAKGGVLGILELQKQCRAMGQHLMECAGNGREARFGLLSVAEWEGVPIAAVLDRLALSSPANFGPR